MNQSSKRTGQLHSVPDLLCVVPSTGPCLCRWELTAWQWPLEGLTATIQTKLDGVASLAGQCGHSLHSERGRYQWPLGSIQS